MNTHHILSHLYYFLSVYKHRSYSKVAEEFHVSSSAVSYQIKVLEEKLNVSLVNRVSGQKTHLTPQGEYLGKQCLEFFRHFDAMIDDFLSGEVNKEYRITAPVSFGSYVLLPEIESISREIPEPDFSLIFNNSILDMDENAIDIAIRNTIPPSNVEYEFLIKIPYVAFTSKDYLAKAPPLNEPQDLTNHAIVQLSNSRRDWKRIVDYYTNITLPKGEKFTEIVTSFNNNSIVKAVQLELGIGLVPSYVYENIEDKSSLQRVLVEYINEGIDELKDSLYICYPSLSIRKEKIKEIVSLLRERLNKSKLLSS